MNEERWPREAGRGGVAARHADTEEKVKNSIQFNSIQFNSTQFGSILQ
jgi:hypothetical protein